MLKKISKENVGEVHVQIALQNAICVKMEVPAIVAIQILIEMQPLLVPANQDIMMMVVPFVAVNHKMDH